MYISIFAVVVSRVVSGSVVTELQFPRDMTQVRFQFTLSLPMVLAVTKPSFKFAINFSR